MAQPLQVVNTIYLSGMIERVLLSHQLGTMGYISLGHETWSKLTCLVVSASLSRVRYGMGISYGTGRHGKGPSE